MVDLPTIPQRDIYAKAPSSSVSASQIASPYMELAGALENASKEVGGLANREAGKAGLTAVTRDDAGNPQVERPFIVGDAALHYEHGVKVAAVADGDSKIRTKMIEFRHQFQDDPDGFAKAAGAFTKETIAQYQKAAGPEVGITLGRIANHQASEFYEGLLNQKERRDVANNKSSIETQIQIGRNELTAIIAQGAPDDSPAVQNRLEKIGVLYGQLVNNPKFGVPQVVADYDFQRLKSEIQVARLGYKLSEIQKDRGPEGGTENALRAADRILTDTTLQLTPPERTSLHSRLVGGILAQERAERQTETRVDKQIDDAAKRSLEGYPIPPAELAGLRTQVGLTNSPELAAKLAQVEQIGPVIGSWKQANPAQMEVIRAGIEAQLREHGSLPGLLAQKHAAEKLEENMRKGLSDNMLDWANRTGTVPIPRIDWSQQSHQNLATQIRDRVGDAEGTAAYYQRPIQYFTPDDRVVAQQRSAVGGQPMLDFARSIVDGAGPRAPAVISEFSKDAPVLAHVTSLMGTGGSPGLIRDAAEAVALAADPKYQHPKWLEKESDTIQLAQTKVKKEEYGNAFAGAAAAGNAAVMTANKAFFTRSARDGYDPKIPGTDEKEAYKRTLQEAAGARYDGTTRVSGGVDDYKAGDFSFFGIRTSQKVLLPTNVRAGEFKTIIGAIRDEDLKGTMSPEGKPYTAERLRAALPVARPGGYAFYLGSPLDDNPKPLMGADGQPFVLDLHAMEPILRKRVGFAYAY